MIALGADHGGYELKESIKKHLDEKGVEYKDFGTYTGEAIDYPIIAKQVALSITSGECERGILCCGTGVGISIAANKVKGIRCACCSDCFSAHYTRLHNDANILAMGGRVIGAGLALMMVDTFLETEFEGGRHARRVDLITQTENEN